MRLLFICLTLILFATFSCAQVIDMHMHSYTEKDFWVSKARNGFESSKTSKEQQLQAPDWLETL